MSGGGGGAVEQGKDGEGMRWVLQGLGVSPGGRWEPQEACVCFTGPSGCLEAQLRDGVEVMALVQVHSDGDSVSCDER